MWETAWNLPEQLTSSPLKRVLLVGCFTLRHGFSFHLDNLRILWIKIYHSVLWSKSHTYLFLTQSLVQNKSISSFPLIFVPLGWQIFGKNSQEKLLFQASNVFAMWPAGILGNVLWDVVCHQLGPSQWHTWPWAAPSCWCDQRYLHRNKQLKQWEKTPQVWLRAEKMGVTNTWAAASWCDADMSLLTWACSIQPELLGLLAKQFKIVIIFFLKKKKN